MAYYIEAFKKYLVFKGRSSRKEYWFFLLINIIIFSVFQFIEKNVQSPGILNVPYGFIILIPSLAVSVRRLHDTNRSGWWCLIQIIPIIGIIIFLIFMAQEGQSGENQYGPNVKILDRSDSWKPAISDE